MTSMDNSHRGQQPQEGYFKRLLHCHPDRHIELVLALAIAVFAGVQLCVTISNDASTGRQVSRLITATGEITAASQQFSTSASEINTGVGNAVKKLNDQAAKLGGVATQMSRLANETAQANANVLDADRPWVGGFLTVSNFAVGKKATFRWTFLNTGKRPARVRLSVAREGIFLKFPSDPSKYLVSNTPNSTDFVVPGQTFRAVSTIPAPLTKQELSLFATPNGPIYFAFAEVEYSDTKTKATYWTHLCYRYYPTLAGSQGFNEGFANCNTYNDDK